MNKLYEAPRMTENPYGEWRRCVIPQVLTMNQLNPQSFLQGCIGHRTTAHS